MKLVNSKLIKTNLGTYFRSLETREFIFFVNFEESDENASVKMFNKKRELISDNYFAYEAFMEAMEVENEHKIWWISDKLKKLNQEKKS
jgi:hypothetical protein